MLHRSAVGKLSSLSSRTKWQRLPAGDTLRSVSPAGNRCYFVLLDKDESCPTADLSNIRPSQRSGRFDLWAVEYAPDICFVPTSALQHGELHWPMCWQAVPFLWAVFGLLVLHQSPWYHLRFLLGWVSNNQSDLHSLNIGSKFSGIYQFMSTM